MSREIPRILEVESELLGQWELVRERRVPHHARLDGEIIAELAKAWNRRYDIAEIIRVWEELSSRDARGHPCMCGGWGKVPLWAQLALDGSLRADLYVSDGGWTTAHCFVCNRATTATPDASGQTGDECSICGGLGLAPAWVTNGIMFPWGAIDRVPVAGMWFPSPCSGCGGWGRRWPGEAGEQLDHAGDADAVDDVEPPRAASPRDPSTPLLERDGREWRAALGGQEARIPHRVGLLYLAELIVRPDEFVHVMDLVAMRQPPAEALRGEPNAMGRRAMRGDDGLEVSDREALRKYHERLIEIEAEIDEAGEANDEGRRALLQDEQAKIIAEVSAAEGLKGPRRTSSTSERARQSVTKAISESIELIAKCLPALGQHLRQQVDMGQQVRYRTVPAK